MAGPSLSALSFPHRARGFPRRSQLLCYLFISGAITLLFTYSLLRGVKDRPPVYQRKEYGYTDPLSKRSPSGKVPQGHFPVKCPASVDPSYQAILQKTASDAGVLMLALADVQYLDMTLNFYETSLKPLAINNVLFISPYNKTCVVLRQMELACHVYRGQARATSTGSNQTTPTTTTAANLPRTRVTVAVAQRKPTMAKRSAPQKSVKSEYGTVVFNEKMVLRTKAIIDALRCGVTILHTDVDITLFKNPFYYFPCKDCDIQALEDGWKDNMNAGFVFMKPTKSTIAVYQLLLNITSNPRYDDQVAFNMALKKLRRTVRVKALDTRQFPCGSRYFEQGQRYYADDMKPCPECVLVHNNWIVSKEAKIYRFRETGQWMYDHGEMKYYSDPQRKYLLYSNPLSIIDEENALRKLENSSLASALAIGRLLNRTVILPKFHCSKEAKTCPFNSIYRVSSLESTFPSSIREHIFLQHAKVPDSVKTSQSPLIYLKTKVPYGDLCKPPKDSTDKLVCVPADAGRGLTSDELLRCLQPVSKYAVLRFYALYGAFSHYTDEKAQRNFHRDVKKGLVKTVYRQYPAAVVSKMGKPRRSLLATVRDKYLQWKKYLLGPDFQCH